MEQKYFTPDITDIRVGYEYEYFLGGNWHKGKVFDLYTDRMGCGIGELQGYLAEGNLRVPYLTKNQVEKEGWELCADYDEFSFMAEISKSGITYRLFWTEDLMLEIYDPNDYYTYYKGECKDINTFRFICKLLNID